MYSVQKCVDTRAYRTHGDRDVKVLGPIVLLECVDIKPNLINTHRLDTRILKYKKQIIPELKKETPECVTIKVCTSTSCSYLVFTR